MGVSVHDKSACVCCVCGEQINGMALSIRSKEKGFIVRRVACPRCYNDHYSKGE